MTAQEVKSKSIEWYDNLNEIQRIRFIEKHFKKYSIPFSSRQKISLWKKEFYPKK